VRLVLASTSPARMATLRAAGIEPIAIAPGVDEEAAVAAAAHGAGAPLAAPAMVQLLGRLKAEAVAGMIGAAAGGGTGADADPRLAALGSGDVLVFGGDSAFELDGVIHGKPHRPEIALERWRAQRGRTGMLHSGHRLIRLRDGVAIDAAGEASQAAVTFSGDLDDAELEAYVATGEPLQVAGAFTIDARGAAFIDRIDGDPSTVVGLSIPLLRRLVRRLGVTWTDLWAAG
jgi:septum formation protein